VTAARSALLFWSPFDIHRFRAASRTEPWLEYRFRHWLAFTLPSVLGQDVGDFRYWLVCDPSNRQTTERFAACIRDERVRLVYADDCRSRLRRLPRCDRYLVTRLDSDDLYHPSVGSNLVGRLAKAEFFQFNHGFAVDFGAAEVRAWRSPSSPFYCHVYGDELRSLDSWAEPNHTTVSPRAKVLGPGHFLIALHGENTTSSIHLGVGRFADSRARQILGSFGLGGSRGFDTMLSCARGPADWQARRVALREELSRLHAKCLADLTSEVMAISLETATLFRFLCEATGARRILDLGAGFSSAVARSYAARNGAVCHSVDTSRERLGRTKRFLEDCGLPVDGLFEWSEFLARNEPPYDVVLHDLGNMRIRAESLVTALAQALPTGFVLLDDGHFSGYADFIERTLARYSADVYPQAADLTRDRLGRSALLLGRVLGPLD
jgi:predicted O-methyltransferase YrrM